MESIYFLILIALIGLAFADLIVGVSNDAVNFLNSAIGSKVLSFKTIMIVASIGIFIGCVFSSGMMEVARKGIFNPGEFMFSEIMIIFMAVMITDILLLDFFNTIGMPTSTTVSIVFELLGASVAMALIKIGVDNGSFSDLAIYINTSKATQIILGILLSVFVAFTIGAIVQWISRLLLSYDFKTKATWIGAVFGGIALTAISYFILMKGIKGTSYAGESFSIIGGVTIKDFLESNVISIIAYSSVLWSFISYVLIHFFNVDIYKVIIGVGTFALALAFAGNDLVNFIGVPIAAWQSYEAWVASGVAANEFSMQVLATKVATPNFLLVIAGVVMVLTLWFSKKAQRVVKTELDLSNQGEVSERFNANFLSRFIVRVASNLSNLFNRVLPTSVNSVIEKRFEIPEIFTKKISQNNRPSFDVIRASVNLMVAGILISFATSYKLPLSTTYVTFMVAMGTSLSDRAWGSESAVYRVAGVLNVIAGWFGTALIAFTAAGVIAYLINISELMIAVLLFFAILLLVRNYIKGNKEKEKENTVEEILVQAESSSLQGVINESAKNISKLTNRSSKIFNNVIKGLSSHDLTELKKNKDQIAKLSKEVDNLKDKLFFFIRNLDESSLSASNFYINLLGSLQDITQSIEYISKISHKHINNNHRKLTLNQIRDLLAIEEVMSELFETVSSTFKNKSFNDIETINLTKNKTIGLLEEKIQSQISRTRTLEEKSPKNTTLYFSILQESKDLMKALTSLIEDYYLSYDKTVKPAEPSDSDN
ncbi:inorganic phosphate transporter [Flavobacteriaceae bacterium]|jgi:phosphate/sulfate permease|nr:inorganic phosphate transporter [Flavobacteriaceae bacterium]MDC1034362.1 inorganic phosphate transporter [Flavobacteriaceae bacterium]